MRWPKLSEKIMQKVKKVKDLMKNKKVLVAFSGGLKSTLVAFFAKIFAEDVKALTFQTATTPTFQLKNAKRIAEHLAIPHKIIKLDICEIKNFQRNERDRCYYCKSKMLSAMRNYSTGENQLEEKLPHSEILSAYGADILVEGTSFSDLEQVKLGLEALEESDVISPLALVKITQKEAKKLSEQFDLPSKLFPSQECLASRVPFGTFMDTSLLEMIDQAEDEIRKIMGKKFFKLKVNIHKLDKTGNYLARIKLENKFMMIVIGTSKFRQIEKQLKKIGFKYVCLDLEDF